MGETGQERCETRLPQRCKANAKVQRRSVQEPQMMKRNSQGCNASAKGLTQAMPEQERFEIRLHQLGRANMWAQWKRKQKRRMKMKGHERERGERRRREAGRRGGRGEGGPPGRERNGREVVPARGEEDEGGRGGGEPRQGAGESTEREEER